MLFFVQREINIESLKKTTRKIDADLQLQPSVEGLKKDLDGFGKVRKPIKPRGVVFFLLFGLSGAEG